MGGLQAPRGHTVYAVALRGYTISLTKREPQHSASDGVGGLRLLEVIQYLHAVALTGHTIHVVAPIGHTIHTCCSH